MAEAEFELTKRSVHPRLALELAQDGIEKQLSFVDGVDSKLANVGGFSSAIVTVYGGLLAVSRREVPEESIWLLVAAGGVYVLLMVAVLCALLPRKWLYTPYLDGTTPGSEQTNVALEKEDLAWAANEYDGMFYANLKKSELKATLLSLALTLLAVETALLVSSSVLLFLLR